MIYVDVRIPTEQMRLSALASVLLRIESLSRINMRPPAAGPEIELQFGPFAMSAGEASYKLVCGLVRDAGATVLASRLTSHGWRPGVR